MRAAGVVGQVSPDIRPTISPFTASGVPVPLHRAYTLSHMLYTPLYAGGPLDVPRSGGMLSLGSVSIRIIPAEA